MHYIARVVKVNDTKNELAGRVKYQNKVMSQELQTIILHY